jgi:hypothetical protein
MDEDDDYILKEGEGEGPGSERREKQQRLRSASRQRSVEQVNPNDLWNDSVESSLSDGSEAEDGDDLSLKRAAEDENATRPFKRQKSCLNIDYLNLLNQEIEDASSRISLHDQELLASSQHGLSRWSAAEKNICFEALARLGRHNLEGISAMIGSKSVTEVNHYLIAVRNSQDLRRKTDHRAIITKAEYPAASELSQHCCRSLEAAADDISVRQERKEQQREEAKWGDCWDLTPKLARRLNEGIHAPGGKYMPALELFRLSTWLDLSRSLFMNSSIPGDNWTYISPDPPSIWATTLDDFYSLAVSITRRLVQTTIFINMARIKAQGDVRPVNRALVKRSDVRAAILSLGMPSDMKEFWRRSSRRLRLEVYENPPSFEDDSEAEMEPIAHEIVEQMLSEDIHSGTDAMPYKETEHDIEISEMDNESESNTSINASDDEEEVEIKREANEVLRYSAADFPQTYRMKETLHNRIALERQEEEHAERCDEYASYQEELEMWRLLQQEPDLDLPKRTDPGKRNKTTLDVEGIYPIGRDWSSKLQYRSEWETSE